MENGKGVFGTEDPGIQFAAGAGEYNCFSVTLELLEAISKMNYIS